MCLPESVSNPSIYPHERTCSTRGTPGIRLHISQLPITWKVKGEREFMMTLRGDASLLNGIMLVRRRAYEECPINGYNSLLKGLLFGKGNDAHS
jgi:hypothetical protein